MAKLEQCPFTLEQLSCDMDQTYNQCDLCLKGRTLDILAGIFDELEASRKR